MRILQATGEVGCLSVAYCAMTVDVVVDGSILDKEEEEEIFRFLLDVLVVVVVVVVAVAVVVAYSRLYRIQCRYMLGSKHFKRCAS